VFLVGYYIGEGKYCGPIVCNFLTIFVFRDPIEFCIFIILNGTIVVIKYDSW
jgi:hypothetical protein